MSKIFKDQKIFNKFKKKYKFIFKDKDFIQVTKNHFNKNGSLAVFTLVFLESNLGQEQLIKSAKINSDDWIDLFRYLYTDENIENTFKILEWKPAMSFDDIKKSFNCFNAFLEKILMYIKQQDWLKNKSKEDIKNFLLSGYGYILYNSVDCNLDKKLTDIVKDTNYETKLQMILNNTKLFANVKKHIRKNCGSTINDFIVIVLGGSKQLSLDK